MTARTIPTKTMTKRQLRWRQQQQRLQQRRQRQQRQQIYHSIIQFNLVDLFGILILVKSDYKSNTASRMLAYLLLGNNAMNTSPYLGFPIPSYHRLAAYLHLARACLSLSILSLAYNYIASLLLLFLSYSYKTQPIFHSDIPVCCLNLGFWFILDEECPSYHIAPFIEGYEIWGSKTPISHCFLSLSCLPPSGWAMPLCSGQLA